MPAAVNAPKPPMRPFQDRHRATVKAGHVLRSEDGRLFVVLRRVAQQRQSVRGLEDLDVVQIDPSPGASSCYLTARYTQIVGLIDLAKANR